MDLATTMRMELRGTATNVADLTTGGTAPNAVLLGQFIAAFTDGTGSGAANQIYADTNSIVAGATNTYDLVANIDDIYGDQMSFTRIKAIYFRNTSTTASVLHLGGGSNGAGLNAFDTFVTSTADDGSEVIIVRAGGAVMLWCPDATGYVCTAGSDILAVIETSTLAGSYDLVVVGEV